MSSHIDDFERSFLFTFDRYLSLSLSIFFFWSCLAYGWCAIFSWVNDIESNYEFLLAKAKQQQSNLKFYSLLIFALQFVDVLIKPKCENENKDGMCKKWRKWITKWKRKEKNEWRWKTVKVVAEFDSFSHTHYIYPNRSLWWPARNWSNHQPKASGCFFVVALFISFAASLFKNEISLTVVQFVCFFFFCRQCALGQCGMVVVRIFKL